VSSLVFLQTILPLIANLFFNISELGVLQGRLAKDNAIRNGVLDDGFNVKITKDDIKEGTDRKRIKEPVMEFIVKKLKSAGFEAEAADGEINVFVPPVLGPKDSFSLDEISERERIIEEINTREEIKLSKE